jgi:hypothetical protein
MPRSEPRRSVIVEDEQRRTLVWVTDEGLVIGDVIGEEEPGREVIFSARQDLIDRWDETRADVIVRGLALTVGPDGRLIA